MDFNQRLTGILPKETQDAGVKVIGLEDHETMTYGIVQGFRVDFKTLSIAKAKRLIRKGAKFLVIAEAEPKNKNKKTTGSNTNGAS